MKLHKAKKPYRFFLALLFSTVVFIALSAFVIIKVNYLRTDVEYYTADIHLASKIEQQSTSAINFLERNNREQLLIEMDSLSANKNAIRSSAVFTGIFRLLGDLKKFNSGNTSSKTSKALADKLSAIQKASREALKERRQDVAQTSERLEDYWIYTYILLGISCVLAILLLLSTFFVTKTIKQLIKLKKQNRLLFKNSIDCVCTTDEEGRLVEFNKASEKAFGYRAAEIHKKNLEILYASKEDCDAVVKALTENGLFSGEVRNKDKDGKIFVSFLSANLLYDENRKVIGTMGISRDITAQKKLESELQHIIGNATDIIYTADVQGYFTYVNESATTILGYSVEELIGKLYADLIHPDYHKLAEQHYVNQFTKKSTDSYLEFKAIKKDGSNIWVGQNVKTVFSAVDKGKITGFQGIVRNINERKEAELSLARNEEKYRELFDSSSDLIQSVDASGNFLYVNAAWEKTLGYTPREIKELNLFQTIHPESIEHYTAIFGKIMANGYGKSLHHTYSMITKYGEKVIVEGGLSIKRENDKVASIQTFLRDVTFQKLTQGALQKSETNFRQITETINDVFYLYNIVDKKYEYISPNCGKILGADQQFFYSGRSHTSEFVNEEDIQRLREANTLVDEGNTYEIEFRINLNGEIRWISEKSFPIRNAEGTVIKNSGICRDITNVKQASETIYNQNIEIGQSILYAKSILDSTLPSETDFKNIFPESFVFYTPKDILSGDFYVVDNFKTREDRALPAFIVADCTGHGVPGGILNLLCTGLIREAFTSRDVNTPAEVLNFARKRLIEIFRSNRSKFISDGMDAGVCVIDHEAGKLYYAGANNSCFIIRNSELIEYRGDRKHVGYSPVRTPFTDHIIDIQKGDCIYMFTDGFIDQYGGVMYKKFMRKKLKELLISIHKEHMDRQFEMVEHEFYEWKGTEEQTDDVILLGVRI
ncbi:MAG: PAS domain S-box protein [Bacteroidota bacterium]|nr:PAS domain S-box protein [Bacteroidota bacterium]